MDKVFYKKLSFLKYIHFVLSIFSVATFSFLPSIVLAQEDAPVWLKSETRNLKYPQQSYYTGYSEVSVAQGEGSDNALARAKQLAIDELSGSIRVVVSSNKTLTDESVSGSAIEEQIRSKFFSEVKTVSQTDVVGSKVDSYFDSKSGTAFAFAYVSKVNLASYYQKQISLWLNKVDGALQSAGEFAQKGYKVKARKQCESVIDLFAKVFYAQDLLTATDKQVNDSTLQQNRSEHLRNTLVQTLTDLENSIYIYLQCVEKVNGQNFGYIANRLPGIITEKGCGCNFTDSQDEADYIIKVDSRFVRCTNAPDNMVFCYANASASVYNTHTKITLIPSIAEAKGGWTNGNNEKATETAFKELAEEIAEKVIPMIKN